MPLERLTPKHYEIMRKIVRGWRNVDIAEDLGMTESYIASLKSDPLFAEALEEMHRGIQEAFRDERAKADPIRTKMDSARERAIETLVDLVTNEEAPYQVRMRSAQDILDRTGYKPTEKVQVDANVVVDDKNVKDLTAAIAALREMRRGVL